MMVLNLFIKDTGKRPAKYFYRVLAGCLCFLFCTHAFSQTINLKNYSVDDALPSSNVYMAFQDSRGFVWFGGDLGVTRFDGNTFVHFNTKDGLSDNEVFNFFEDREGRIWFQTKNGKVSYYKDGHLFDALLDTTLRPLDSDSFITSMTQDSTGAIWITSSRHGIVRYDTDHRATRFYSEGEFERINNLFFTSRTQAVMCTGKGFFEIKFDESFQKVKSTRNLNTGPAEQDRYSKSLMLPNGEIIMKTNEEVRWYRLESPSEGLIHETRREDRIYSLSQDPEYLWVGTGNGVLQFGIHDKTLRQNILENHLVTSVLKDWEGNYWFTTMGKGVFFCTSLEMLCYTTTNGLLVDKVSCLSVDNKNRVWIGYDRGTFGGTGGGVSFIDHHVLNHFQLLHGKVFSRMVTNKIRFQKKHAWVATNYGVFKIEDRKTYLYPCYARDVFESSPDSLWLGIGERVCVINYKIFERDRKDARTFRIDPTQHYFTDTRRLNQEEDRIKSFFRDSGNKLWMGAEKRIYHFEEGSFATTEYKTAGLQSYITDFAELTDHRLVVSTHGSGIAVLKEGRNVFTIAEAQGLSSNMCTAIEIDRAGVIWVATNKGINRIDGYPDNIAITYVNSNDGLLSNEVTDVIVVHDTVWVATTKGINLFHKDVVRKTNPPRIFIDYISVAGRPFKITDQRLPELSYKENDLSIMYTGLSFSNGNDILYRYKLHPEDAWRFTRSTSVYLPELPSDHYQFIVSAQGRSGEWSEEAIVTFVINKPFWKTTAFVITCSLILAGLIWLATALYFKQQRKELQRQHQVTLSELKTLRAQMNPHFLFNALNSIQGVLLKNNLANTQDYLSRFGKLMRTILDHSDKSTITIAEELESITNYLEIEILRTNYQFQYTIDISPELDIHNTEIPAMILQPFIENAIWHGFNQRTTGNNLLIKFLLTDTDSVVITIEDNGIGRKKAMLLRSKAHRSKGVSLVQERIEILNYGSTKKIQLSVKDLADDNENSLGTRITLIIPVS